MNVKERNSLIREAERQTEALKQISSWRTMATGVSTIGAALIYAGFIGSHHPVIGIGGAAFLLLGMCGAVIFNLGLKNGRRNVEKILRAAGKAGE